jgi:hypothetical protein
MYHEQFQENCLVSYVLSCPKLELVAAENETSTLEKDLSSELFEKGYLERYGYQTLGLQKQ